MRRYLTLLFLGMSIACAKGQEVDSLVLKKELDEVVVTAQFYPLSPESALIPVNVITGYELNQTASFRLRDAVFQELNFDISQASVFGASPEVNGVSKENVKIMVNGIPVVGRLNGVVDLSQINMDNVKRIEFIEGPSSSYHGTDALGGIVNIITHQKRSGEYGIGGGANYESTDILDIYVNGHANFGKHALQLSGSTMRFGGQSFGDYRLQDWKARDQYHGALDYSYSFYGWRANLRSAYSQDKLTDLAADVGMPVVEDIHYITRRLSNSLILKGEPKPSSFVEVLLSNSDYRRRQLGYNTTLETEKSVKSDDHGLRDTTQYNSWHLKGTYSYNQPESDWHFLIGTENTIETSKGRRILDGSQSLGDYSIFGAVKYFLKEVVVEPSTRLTHYAGSTVITPSIIFKWKVGNGTQVWGAYANGFSRPSIRELYLDFFLAAGPSVFHIEGNENLQPEKSNQYQLGIGVEFNLGAMPNNFSIKGYYNDLVNLIALSPIVNNQRHYININSDETFGLYGEWTLKPLNALSITLGGHVFGNKNDFFADNTSEVLDEYLWSADWSGKIVYCLPKWRTTLSLNYKNRGERTGYFYSRSDKDYFETRTESLNILDFGVSKHMWKGRLRLNAGVKNIFDVTNIEELTVATGTAHVTSLFAWGRSYYIGLGVQLK